MVPLGYFFGSYPVYNPFGTASMLPKIRWLPFSPPHWYINKLCKKFKTNFFKKITEVVFSMEKRYFCNRIYPLNQERCLPYPVKVIQKLINKSIIQLFNYRIDVLSTKKDKKWIRMDGCPGFGTVYKPEVGILFSAQWLIKVINIHIYLLQ